jgi:hypothetical protein
MGGLFAVGAICFVVGPLSAYSNRVGPHADALTFFVGSILFTAGGMTQARLALPERGAERRGLLAWRGAWIQAIGTVLFNVMTLAAISRTPADTGYRGFVWTPNALGSICFLVSGIVLYQSAPRVGWRPLFRAPGWWEPPVNLLGCLLFAISAVASFSVAPAGTLLDAAGANWTTSAGAACFLAVGLAALVAGMSFKFPRLSRLVAFERRLGHVLADAEREVGEVAGRTERDVEAAARAAERLMAERLMEVDRS